MSGEEGNSMDSAFAGIDELEAEDDESENGSQDDPEAGSAQLQGDISQAVDTQQASEQTATTDQPSNTQSLPTSDTNGRGSVDENDIPPRLKYDSPTEGRQSLNIYVTPEDKQRLNDLKSLAEREFDKSVRVIDVYLAALRSDFYNDESFLAEMRTIGYGLFD
jgi:FtsZ-interacting cell division protein ZipA